MSQPEILERYRAAFSGTLWLNDLQPLSSDAERKFYVCPCGCGHMAIRASDSHSSVGDGFAVVLHCYHTGKQWMLRKPWEWISDVLREEEGKAMALFDRAKSVVPKFLKKHGLSGQSLTTLHHTHGYDPDIVEVFVQGGFDSDLRHEYERCYAEHRKTGQSKPPRSPPASAPASR
jgi:hypothetical protein